jgi:hypothetical protein
MRATNLGFERVGRAVRVGLLLVAGWAGGPERTGAFPPAPYHTIYGMARGELGQPLEGRDVQVIVESPTGRVLRAGVGTVSIAGANYVVRIPMDTGVFDPPYHPTALRPLTPFRLKVLVGATVLLPIEMRGDFRELGKPGERTRIDLTLGEDTDGDGLPDAWERILLGMLGGEDLRSFDPGADADGDGLSNREEYLAGTYATDPADGFRLDLVAQGPDGPVLEFLAIRGRTYSLQASANLRNWATRRFRLVGTEDDLTSLRATDTRMVRIVARVDGEEESAGFFNLRVE